MFVNLIKTLRTNTHAPVKRYLLAFIASAVFTTAGMAQIDWTPYAGNPVIDPDFDPGSTAIFRPTVVKWQNKYHMWYGKSWLSSRWMAYATSDDGVNWEPAWHAVLGPSQREGTFDRAWATYGSVVLDGDTLKMWYAGQGDNGGGLGLAWSVDGITWTKVPGLAGANSVLSPASEGSGATAITLPAVVKHDGGYHMWYSRITPVGSTLGYARSADGISWEVIPGGGTDGAVVDVGAEGDFDRDAILYPTVVHNGQIFEMWYQGVGDDPVLGPISRIGCAKSADGITWEKIAGEQSGAGACFNSLGQPFVLLDGDLYKMWYALSATEDDVILYATSEKRPTTTEQTELPSQVATLDVYPNPMTASTNIKFTLLEPGVFLLEAHDILGRTVSTTNLGARTAGEQLATWNGLDSQGTEVPAGAYVMTISDAISGARSAASLVYVVR